MARARSLGIETVYQERALCEKQPIWRNMFMGREPRTRWGLLDVHHMRAESARLMSEHMGFTSAAVHPDNVVATMSGGEKQGVAITRALYFDAQLVILDEPTVGLSLTETKKTLDFVGNIKKAGKSAIFIDHNIFHVYPIVDRLYVLDRGRGRRRLRRPRSPWTSWSSGSTASPRAGSRNLGMTREAHDRADATPKRRRRPLRTPLGAPARQPARHRRRRLRHLALLRHRRPRTSHVNIYSALPDHAAVRHHRAGVDLRRHHRRDRPLLPLDHGARRLGLRRRSGGHWTSGSSPLRHRRSGGLINGLLVALNIPSLVITIGTSFLFRGRDRAITAPACR